MTLQTQLDNLRDALPACERVAFGDLSAQLILRSSTAGSCSREILDGACRKAKAVFDAMAETQDVDVLDAATFARSAILFDATATHLFVRHSPETDDVVLAEMEGARSIVDALSQVTTFTRELAETTQ